MRYAKVVLQALAQTTPPVAVTSRELEAALAPAYARLSLPAGQLAALTGIEERRWWPAGQSLADAAAVAAEEALAQANVPREDVGVLIYCGVCREQFEPATACRIADQLRLAPTCEMFDLSNACLGMLNGLVEAANRIELGQTRAALVVSAESAREINEETIRRLNRHGTMEDFRLSLATLTGGSGAAAALLTDGGFGGASHRFLGGVTRSAPRHHELCRWGVERDGAGYRQFMRTDAAGVLRHGVELGQETWAAFLDELRWRPELIDRVICHQVGGQHREEIQRSLGIDPSKDFSTYPLLGNTGTVALPAAAALAAEQGFLRPGQRVAFLGIGSGLTCQMLGWEW